MKTILTDKERQFIRHALGLDNENIGYRNKFFASGSNIEIGRALIKKGLAIHYPPEKLRKSHLFVITTPGFNAACNDGETMDREEVIAMKIYDQNAITIA